ncbi:MAG: hypothetical protein KAW83_04250 [Dehalococcoidia bacterium]|nr:hypothetical protein [Dehalococcoidia bacterium]
MRIDWKGAIIPKVNELLGSFSYRPTLRQIFYRLVAALLIPNTEVTYKSLSRATVDARKEGIIPSRTKSEPAREEIMALIAPMTLLTICLTSSGTWLGKIPGIH